MIEHGKFDNSSECEEGFTLDELIEALQRMKQDNFNHRGQNSAMKGTTKILVTTDNEKKLYPLTQISHWNCGTILITS